MKHTGRGAPRFTKVILSVAPVSTCLFITTFEHGSGAFVLTCGCYWVMVSVEYATGETSGYWYCGEVTETWPLWMRLQEMDLRLLKRAPSTRCTCWNRSAQEMRVEDVTDGAGWSSRTRAGDTAGNNDTREERSSGSLVDVKLVTKQNELSGKQDRKER